MTQTKPPPENPGRFSLLHGVAIEVQGKDDIILAGACPRNRSEGNRSPLKSLNVDLFSIIYDEAGENLNLAIDSLARYRVWRRFGDLQMNPKCVRASAVLLKFIQHQGVDAPDCYEVLSSSFNDFSFGGVKWEKDSAPEILKGWVSREYAGFFVSYRKGTLGAFSLWLGGEPDALLDLRTLRGRNGRRYGRMTLESAIPLTVANAAIGRPVSALVSYPLTDPFRLGVVDIRVTDAQTAIYFDGAEQMRKHSTLFADSALDALFKAEVATLWLARAQMFDMLSMASLPDGWWRRFKKLVTGRGVPQIAVGTPLKTTFMWAPGDNCLRPKR